MLSDYTLKKKDVVGDIGVAFLPRRVLIPLCQEKNVECTPIVQTGQRVREGDVIAENIGNDSAKIHSSIPGLVRGIKKCSYPNGKFGDALEIELSGKFSHIGHMGHSFDWSGYGSSSLLNRISALGLLNTFSMSEAHSLAADIAGVLADKTAQGAKKIFVRLFDEDLSCQTDTALSACSFEKIMTSLHILSEIMGPKEIVFAYAKSDGRIVKNLEILKAASQEYSWLVGIERKFIQINKNEVPCGTRFELALAYKKAFKIQESMKALYGSALFVDAASLVLLADSIVYNVPVEQVYVYVSGDCLCSSAVLKVCTGISFGELSRQLGLNGKKIGKIIVNGFLNGFSVSSLDTPVTKYVKSVAFISSRDAVDYSSGICLSCGKCRAACPVSLCPDVFYGHIINSVKIPQDFVRSSLLCSGCGLCNTVCPVKLPLSQSAKLLKERQNA